MRRAFSLERLSGFPSGSSRPRELGVEGLSSPLHSVTPRRTDAEIAEALETAYAVDIDAHLGELATHYMEAGS